jgi:hypothetical protein
LSDIGSAKDVFTQFMNQGGWSSQGLSFFVGLIGSVFAFVGGDAAVHVSQPVLSHEKAATHFFRCRRKSKTLPWWSHALSSSAC